MTAKYLTVLAESLVKKKEVLLNIRNITFAQKDLLAAEYFDPEQFDKYVEDKDKLIQELILLDEGFQTLFDKVKEEVTGNKDKYAEQIGELKVLIKEVTDLNLSIQAQEARNKEMVESYFKKQRDNIGKLRKSTKVVSDYYKSAYNVGVDNSRILDAKK